MADYESTFTTNEFSVTDEARFQELLSMIEGNVKDYPQDENGIVTH